MDLSRNEIGNHAPDHRMKILALENSSARGSVALLDHSQEPIVFEHQSDRKHSGAFFQSLERLSDRFRDADAIVVGLGPGSYAGIRIAISSAIGLSFGGGTGSVPSQDFGRHGGRPSRLIGYPSICAIESDDYCVIGDARRESFFLARIRKNEIVEGIDLFSKAALSARLEKMAAAIPVYSSETLLQFPRAIVRYPSALMLAKLIQSGVVHASRTPLEPIYLREPHITTPNDKRNVSLLG